MTKRNSRSNQSLSNSINAHLDTIGLEIDFIASALSKSDKMEFLLSSEELLATVSRQTREMLREIIKRQELNNITPDLISIYSDQGVFGEIGLFIIKVHREDHEMSGKPQFHFDRLPKYNSKCITTIHKFIRHIEKQEGGKATTGDVLRYIKNGYQKNTRGFGNTSLEYVVDYLIDCEALPASLGDLFNEPYTPPKNIRTEKLDQKIDLGFFKERYAEEPSYFGTILRYLYRFHCDKEQVEVKYIHGEEIIDVLKKGKLTNKDLFLAYEYAYLYEISPAKRSLLEDYLKHINCLPEVGSAAH
jgi:hypothetical protein